MNEICLVRWKCGGFALILLAAGLLTASPQVGSAQIFRRSAPCVPCPTAPLPSEVQPGTVAPSGTGAATPTPAAGGATEPSPSSDLLAQQDVGAAGGPASAAPNMVGDQFGLGGFILVRVQGTERAVTVPLAGATVPRFKMAEDTSPLPQDRVFFDYNFYHEVPIDNPPIDVNAFAPGFEKTFLDERLSFELRLPMAKTLSNNVFLDGTTSTSEGETGDLAMVVKGLLIRRDTFALSGGLAMTVPTAKGSQYFFSHFDPVPFMTVANQSVHLMPFVGALWTPNDRLFAIGYLQVDVDVGGNPVTVVDSGRQSTTDIGRFRDATLLYLDLTVGYWILRSDAPEKRVTGLAPVLELHMNQTLDAASTLSSPSFGVGIAGADTSSILDLTLGAHVELHNNTTLTAGYCTPLTPDREFDGEFRFFVNHRF